MVHRGADRWRKLPDLCREGSPADLQPGDIVIMDNLGSHKSKRARSCGRLSVPSVPSCSSCQKYSPDLNPIEQVFAKLKHLLRKAAARTVDAVCAAIGDVLTAFASEECANYFKKCRLSNLMLSRFSSLGGIDLIPERAAPRRAARRCFVSATHGVKEYCGSATQLDRRAERAYERCRAP